MIVDALKAITEGWFKEYSIFPQESVVSIAPTGERFWTVTSSMVDKPEGAGREEHTYTSAEAAMDGFKWIIEGLREKYPPEEDYVLYWRCRPELESDSIPVRWRIYSRLLLSKKKIINNAHKDD